MFRRQQWHFVLFVLLVGGLMLLSTVLPAVAVGNSIDDLQVTTPACSGSGQVAVTFTTDGIGLLALTIDPPATFSINLNAFFTPGSHTTSGQYSINVPPGTIIAVTAKLGTSFFADDIASKTIHFNCTTGVLANPPVAVDDSANTPANTPVNINVVANDTDPDGDLNAASAHSTADPVSGALVNNGDGTFTYTPDTNFIGTDGFDYEVCDATNLCAGAHVSIEVVNLPPDCSEVAPSVSTLWPPNHQMVAVNITGATDPESGSASVMITDITSNEGGAEDDTAGVGTDMAMLRAERDGGGSGRTYTISFTADDGNGGTCSGIATVNVPHDQGKGNDSNTESNINQTSTNTSDNGNGNAGGNGSGGGNGNGNAGGNNGNNGNGNSGNGNSGNNSAGNGNDNGNGHGNGNGNSGNGGGNGQGNGNGHGG